MPWRAGTWFEGIVNNRDLASTVSGSRCLAGRLLRRGRDHDAIPARLHRGVSCWPKRWIAQGECWWPSFAKLDAAAQIRTWPSARLASLFPPGRSSKWA